MFWKLKGYVGSSKDWTSSQKRHPLRVTKFIEPHLAQEVSELKIAGGLKSIEGSTTCLLCSDSPLGIQLKPSLEAGYRATWTLGSALIEPCLYCSLFAKEIRVPRENNGTLVCKILSNKHKQPEEAITPWLPKLWDCFILLNIFWGNLLSDTGFKKGTKLFFWSYISVTYVRIFLHILSIQTVLKKQPNTAT